MQDNNINNNVNNVKRVFNDMDKYVYSDEKMNNELIESVQLEELFQSYIGKNVDKLTNGRYSFCTLFFGLMYFIYRKFWLYAFTYLIVRISLFYSIGLYTIVVIYPLNILFGFFFKYLYIHDVEVVVKRIKKRYPNKDLDELKEICRKKGGTSLISVIIYIVMFFSVVYGISLYNQANTTDGLVEHLYLNVPDTFEKSSGKKGDPIYFTSNFKDSLDRCLLQVNAVKGNLYSYNPKAYINNNSLFVSNIPTYNQSDIKTVTIHDREWYYITYSNGSTTQYLYSAVYNDYIYAIEYTIYSNFDNTCKSSFEEIINSATLR